MTTRREQLLVWAAAQGDDTGRTVRRAIDTAVRAHDGHQRYNGENYAEHAMAAALTLTEHKADLDTIAATLLRFTHAGADPKTIADLQQNFGPSIAGLVAEVGVIDHRSYLYEPGADDRVLRMRIATRLSNMRTVSACTDESQRFQADSTLDLVAPLARRLGMADVADELNTLATATLATLNPRHTRSGHIPPPRTSMRTLRWAATLLLPAHCQDRWLTDWHGELHTLPTRRARLAFVLDVLTGLPTMAVLTRRTEHR